MKTQRKETLFEQITRLAREAKSRGLNGLKGLEFFAVTTRDSEDRNKSSNGGDYDFGYTVAVYNGTPFAAYFWTSADFDYCGRCGSFDREICEFDRTIRAQDVPLLNVGARPSRQQDYKFARLAAGNLFYPIA